MSTVAEKSFQLFSNQRCPPIQFPKKNERKHLENSNLSGEFLFYDRSLKKSLLFFVELVVEKSRWQEHTRWTFPCFITVLANCFEDALKVCSTWSSAIFSYIRSFSVDTIKKQTAVNDS